MTDQALRIAILFGGPSSERGISLNSARTIADHVAGIGVSLEQLVYFDADGVPFSIDNGLLYCNTPSDFDYRLHSESSAEGVKLTYENLAERLAGIDLVFPAIHGQFGEDGQLQALLEQTGVPYVGTGAARCAVAFDKFHAKRALAEAGMAVVPSVLVTSDSTDEERDQLLTDAFSNEDTLVLKPAQSGSSIGVHICPDRTSARGRLDELLGEHSRVLIQPRMVGIECTTSVLEGPDGPVALMPTEVELRKLEGEGDYLDFERKYLYGDKVHYHCPPRFPEAEIERIQRLAEQTFAVLGLRDFARIDGWRTADGSFYVSDVNPISGMEQTSFLFVQGAQIGMNHADLLRYVIGSAARRAGLKPPKPPNASNADTDCTDADRCRQLPVILGGATAERQVSVMSGLNVWLKLQDSARFDPEPYLLEGSDTIWRLPYSAALHHSVEEILEVCRNANRHERVRERLAEKIHKRLRLNAADTSVSPALPQRMSLEEFLRAHDLLFIALHGGMGEDGTLQAKLDAHGIRYNGSGPSASRLCIDKAATGEAIAAIEDPHILTARRARLPVPTTPEELDEQSATAIWASVVNACATEDIIVKPVQDGCSAGILRLGDATELYRYLRANASGETELNGRGFRYLGDSQKISMPTIRQRELLFEEFIETDDIDPRDTAETGRARLLWAEKRDTGWVEITVAVLGARGEMRSLNPSITIASNRVLSVQEKFMSGTGINLTPPPGPPAGKVQPAALIKAKEHIGRVAAELGLAGYARIDAFMNRESGNIIVIEVNTLPALTPATVFYQQGIAETPPIPPREILERIVDIALTSEREADGVGVWKAHGAGEREPDDAAKLSR
jgi:D-alanine--D-alanine ligase